MSFNFNADEIFEMAEQMERNGAKFYRKASEGFEDDDAKKMLLGFATMEDEHLTTFRSMRDGLTDKEKETVTFDPDDQAALYLRAMADGYVFDVSVDPAEVLTGDETMEHILRKAIGMERDSIAFYVGLKEKVPERLGKDNVEHIIREEVGHVGMLSNKLREVLR